MDLKQTGRFIAERRKAKKLTQVKLAEILCVSEKTISKWECGNGFPDTSLMLPLCNALDITANELLSAKTLNEIEYKKEAENNLMLLKHQQETNAKFLLSMEIAFMIIMAIFVVGGTILAHILIANEIVKIVVILSFIIVWLVGIFFAVKIEQKAGFYECKCCGHKYIPSYKKVIFAMHFGTIRYMRCPHCHKKSWNKKTLN